MHIDIRAGDIMTRNFIYVSPDTDLKKCAHEMVKKRVSCLIVKDGDSLKGILTKKDIVWAIVKKSKEDLDKILAKDLMKRKVVTIKPSATVVEALNRIKRTKVKRMPVVEHGKVIGVISLKDILKLDPGLYELIAESTKIREESEKLGRSEKIFAQKKQGVCEECGQQDLLYDNDGLWICEVCYSSK